MHITFNKNLGRIDQILRLGISAVMIYLGFIDNSLVTDELTAVILGVAGIVMAFFSLVRSCPMYHLAGINTYRSEDD